MHIRPRAVPPVVAVFAATALAVSGCGGGGGEKATPTSSPKAARTSSPTATGTTSPTKASGVLLLRADPSQLKFDKSTLSAHPGRVTIVMKNPSTLPNDVALEGNGVDVTGKTVNQGGTST